MGFGVRQIAVIGERLFWWGGQDPHAKTRCGEKGGEIARCSLFG
jgi:hypothetical protein